MDPPRAGGGMRDQKRVTALGEDAAPSRLRLIVVVREQAMTGKYRDVDGSAHDFELQAQAGDTLRHRNVVRVVAHEADAAREANGLSDGIERLRPHHGGERARDNRIRPGIVQVEERAVHTRRTNGDRY